MGVEHDAVSLCVAPREPRLPRKGFLPRSGIRLALSELRPGDAADQPGVAGELLVRPLEHIPIPSPLGAPAALERPTVDAGSHQADNSRLNANPLEFSKIYARRAVTFDNALADLLQPATGIPFDAALQPSLLSGDHLLLRSGFVDNLECSVAPSTTRYSRSAWQAMMTASCTMSQVPT